MGPYQYRMSHIYLLILLIATLYLFLRYRTTANYPCPGYPIFILIVTPSVCKNSRWRSISEFAQHSAWGSRPCTSHPGSSGGAVQTYPCQTPWWDCACGPRRLSGQQPWAPQRLCDICSRMSPMSWLSINWLYANNDKSCHTTSCITIQNPYSSIHVYLEYTQDTTVLI